MAYYRVLTVQDISCVGQCSTTVALPVLSACGLETCVLPTALLSTHTGGFGTPHILRLADSIPAIIAHWQSLGIRFHGIYTGYLGSVEAIRHVRTLCRSLLEPGGKLIADPAMADHGRLYSGLDPAYADAMGQLCAEADVILPNRTEAALLLRRPVEPEASPEALTAALEDFCGGCVVLTGACPDDRTTGVAIREAGRFFLYRHRRIPRDFHGTGDLFASAFTGAYLSGMTPERAAALAAEFVVSAMENTLPDPNHSYGVKFETALPELIRAIGK